MSFRLRHIVPIYPDLMVEACSSVYALRWILVRHTSFEYLSALPAKSI